MSHQFFEWLTFGVMILIQTGAAGVIVGVVKSTLKTLTVEVQTLREWKDKLNAKEALYDKYAEQVKDHEERLRVLESRLYTRGKSFEPGADAPR